jgi:hypothetical protein
MLGTNIIKESIHKVFFQTTKYRFSKCNILLVSPHVPKTGMDRNKDDTYSMTYFRASVPGMQIRITLTFERPAFAYTIAGRETPLEIHFIYLGKKEIYCIFKTCCIISVLFPQNDVYFII